LYAENKHSLLIVLQGLDAAGKDGVVKHVFSGFNPQGCTVTSFKTPTAEESRHDFLWRVHPHAPARGSIAIFNRSHYEDVLITKVHQLAKKEILEDRYQRINDFEKLLTEQNGTTVVKFLLHISKEEQLNRFKQRLANPATRWKISDDDYKERDHWEAYMRAFEECIDKTNTKQAPWYVIPSNHKWFRNLAISQIITHTLEGLDMRPPKPTVDIDEIKKLYRSELTKSFHSKKKKS
jgi:PPK2 family polyphosphate:nucleotide phosphotransferase